MPPARNARRLVPPREKAQRRLYYALMGRVKKATSQAQKLYLLDRARSLMVWTEVDQPAGGVVPPPSVGNRPRPRRRVSTRETGPEEHATDATKLEKS